MSMSLEKKIARHNDTRNIRNFTPKSLIYIIRIKNENLKKQSLRIRAVANKFCSIYLFIYKYTIRF